MLSSMFEGRFGQYLAPDPKIAKEQENDQPPRRSFMEILAPDPRYYGKNKSEPSENKEEPNTVIPELTCDRKNEDLTEKVHVTSDLTNADLNPSENKAISIPTPSKTTDDQINENLNKKTSSTSESTATESLHQPLRSLMEILAPDPRYYATEESNPSQKESPVPDISATASI